MFLRFYSIISLSLFLTVICQAQNGIPASTGGRGAAMANASIAFDDINGALVNPAALANIDFMSFGAFAEQRFLVADLQAFAAAVALPTNSGNFGLVLNYFGYSAYNEQKIGLAYARKFSKRISIGAQIDYLNTSIEEYGNRGVLTFDVGLQFQLHEQLRLATHIFNPIRAELNATENLPTLFKLGGIYQPAKSLSIAVEVEKDLDYDARIKLGLEYEVLNAVHLRFGFMNNPSNMTFGLGFMVKQKLQIDVATAYHQTLGFTPSVGVTYRR